VGGDELLKIGHRDCRLALGRVQSTVIHCRISAGAGTPARSAWTRTRSMTVFVGLMDVETSTSSAGPSGGHVGLVAIAAQTIHVAHDRQASTAVTFDGTTPTYHRVVRADSGDEDQISRGLFAD